MKIRSVLMPYFSKAPISFAIHNPVPGVAVRDILTDISTASNERVFVFILDSNLGKQLQQTLS
jgi:uncharacterized protein YbcI